MDGDDDGAAMCHSLEQDTPWISIELPAPSTVVNTIVSQVIIYNRADCCYDRLSPFQLWVGQSAGDFDSATSLSCGVHNLTEPITRGPFSFACGAGTAEGGLVGNYVTVVLPGPSRILNLAEIHVYSPFYSPFYDYLPACPLQFAC